MNCFTSDRHTQLERDMNEIKFVSQGDIMAIHPKEKVVMLHLDSGWMAVPVLGKCSPAEVGGEVFVAGGIRGLFRDTDVFPFCLAPLIRSLLFGQARDGYGYRLFLEPDNEHRGFFV